MILSEFAFQLQLGVNVYPRRRKISSAEICVSISTVSSNSLVVLLRFCWVIVGASTGSTMAGSGFGRLSAKNFVFLALYFPPVKLKYSFAIPIFHLRPFRVSLKKLVSSAKATRGIIFMWLVSFHVCRNHAYTSVISHGITLQMSSCNFQGLSWRRIAQPATYVYNLCARFFLFSAVFLVWGRACM